MKSLYTGRLALIPCSIEIAQAACDDRHALETLLSAHVPDGWPSQDLSDFLPLYTYLLSRDPSLYGWGIWLMVQHQEQVLIGDLGFKGSPDASGRVDLGYGVLPEYRGQGYAFEAAHALVQWALAQPGVRRITAECFDSNLASIRVLERLGMRRVTRRGNLLKWQLKLLK